MKVNLEVSPTNDLGLPWGWFTAGDIAAYQALASELPNKGVVVEIGVWQGRSLCSVASQIKEKNLTVYAVDTFEGTPGVQVVHNAEGKLQQIFEENLEHFNIRPHVTILRNTSEVAAQSFTEFADLIFIDGEHSEEQVIKDIQSWLPRLAPDGVLAGHDYSFVGTFVQKALPEGVTIQIIPGSDVWWVKNPTNS